MPLASGTILGQYEIRGPLGAGGMGEVYRAYDTRLQREVAIKILPESVSSSPERLRRFEQEARAAAALNHPNILAVYQFGSEDGVAYLVSELLEGETIRQRLRRGPVPLRKTIEYGVQIARGLSAPHEKGIVHRDLKPDNLFLTRDGRVKILDFGLAKQSQMSESVSHHSALTHVTEPGIVVGTVAYMSPEQVRGRPADPRSDIFSLGSVLYELITGRQAFQKETSPEIMTAILNDDPTPIAQLAPSTPPGLQRVVQRCMEKDPAQRFQSASDLAFALESLSDSAATPLSGAYPVHKEQTRRPYALGAIAAVIALAAIAGVYLWMQPAPAPRVGNYVQMTHDGAPKSLIGTDGSRLFLNLVAPDYVGLAEMSVSGGDPRKTSVLPANTMFPVALSPDGANLLVIDGRGIPPKGPLWSVPVLGGSPRRLGDIEAQDAAWSRDGNKLAYTSGRDMFIAHADGTTARKIVSMENLGLVFGPVFSPDGNHLRFYAQQSIDTPGTLWEVSTDGKNLHELTPGWNADECCGRWTSDGKYFVFRANGQIWALPRTRGFAHSEPKPIQLTSSPLPLTSSIPGNDGKKLFVTAQTNRGELMRWKSGEFAPFLGGISAEFSAFTKDGQWVAYVSYPQGTLWRSKVDGSEKLQLSYPPNYAMLPRWSPDGKKIVYYEVSENGPVKMYEVSAEGGTPRAVMPDDARTQQDPNWSPDGSKIVFGGNSSDPSAEILVFDETTRQTTTLPGSHGLFSPRWSPDGRFLVAFSADSTRLLLFDFRTQKWTELAKGTLGWPNWSRDGQYVYVLDQSGTGAVLKIRLSDGKQERVVDLKNFSTAGRYNGSLSLAPDDSPLLLRNAGTQDVYALDWETP
ncbi:MAG: protein kinase domain-containing protein [Terriglobales bacterium]